MRQHYFLYILLITCVCTNPLMAQQRFTVLSYNIENAFDTIHDEGKNDYEYCADGERKWNQRRLFQKLNGVCKVIAAADEKHPIDLIGLCEVENDTVMQYLTRRTPLSNIGYRYLMTHSKDDRGIDVALLYSPFTFHPVENQSIKPAAQKQTTRDILHVAGTLTNGDTLDVYVIHLPSKRGGNEGQKLSMSICQQLQAHTDSVRAARQHPNLLVMGDFNAETNSQQLKLLTRSHHLIDRTAKLQPGTYKYQGEWSILDSKPASSPSPSSSNQTPPMVVKNPNAPISVLPIKVASATIYPSLPPSKSNNHLEKTKRKRATSSVGCSPFSLPVQRIIYLR